MDGAALAAVSGPRTPRRALGQESPSVHRGRVVARSRRLPLRDVHATCRPRRSCSWCRRQKRPPSAAAVAGNERSTGALNHRRAQRRDFGARPRDEQAPLTFERDGERLRLDLDDAVSPAHFHGRSRLERGLATDVTRNHEPPGLIHGCCHGMNSTMTPAHLSLRRSGRIPGLLITKPRKPRRARSNTNLFGPKNLRGIAIVVPRAVMERGPGAFAIRRTTGSAETRSRERRRAPSRSA